MVLICQFYSTPCRVEQTEDDQVGQRLPGRLDDVAAHPDRRPRPLAVGGIDEHTRHRSRRRGAVENADLVVDEVDAIEQRVVRHEGGAQGGVDGIHRTVALGGVHGALIAHPHLDRRLGRELTVLELVGDDPHRLDREEVLLPAGGLAHEQLERGVGGFEVVALVLEPLQLVDHVVDGRAVERQPELLRLHVDRRLAGHLRHDEPGAVADELGRDVLVGVLGPCDRADVEARLVGERRRAHVRRLRVERPVEQLGDVVAHRRQPLEPSVRQHVEAHLQLEVRDHRREVGVAGALAEAVHASLHLARARPHRGHGVGDGAAGVVVAVDGDDDVVAEVRLHGRRRSLPPRAGATRRSCRTARDGWPL